MVSLYMAAITGDMQRKVFYIMRHGKAPQMPKGGSYDTLFPSAIRQICQETGKDIQESVNELDIKPNKVFIAHSPRKRALASAQIALVPSYHGNPDFGKYHFPADETRLGLEECDQYINAFLGDFNLDGIGKEENKGLGYSKDVGFKLYMNDDIYLIDPAININFWFQNPNTGYHEGAPIEPYSSVKARTNKALIDAISRLDPEQPDKEAVMDLGLLCSHCGMLESMVVNLINAGRKSKITDINAIGGIFNFAEAAKLVVDVTPSGTYDARLTYKSEDYKVDLLELCNKTNDCS